MIIDRAVQRVSSLNFDSSPQRGLCRTNNFPPAEFRGLAGAAAVSREPFGEAQKRPATLAERRPSQAEEGLAAIAVAIVAVAAVDTQAGLDPLHSPLDVGPLAPIEAAVGPVAPLKAFDVADLRTQGADFLRAQAVLADGL